MPPFCTDIDLLHWEPNILRDAAFASQTLMSGTGDLSGMTLTIESGSFVDHHIAADQVIALDGSIDGCFPIVSVNSATALTISVLYDGLFPLTGEAQPSVLPNATDIPFVIRTFWAQRTVISEILQQASGLIPGDPSTADAVIMNPQALRRPALLGTLQLIYSALAAIVDAPAEYALRAGMYERLYRRALRSTIVHLDLNGDGHAEVRRALNVVELVRR